MTLELTRAEAEIVAKVLEDVMHETPSGELAAQLREIEPRVRAYARGVSPSAYAGDEPERAGAMLDRLDHVAEDFADGADDVVDYERGGAW